MKVDTTEQDRKRNSQNRGDKEGEQKEKERRKEVDIAKINNSQDAAGQKQMAVGFHGLSGPWQKPVTHIT